MLVSLVGRVTGRPIRCFHTNPPSHMHIQALREHCPFSIPQADFVKNSAKALAPLGFTSDNSLPIIATCRDELAMSIHRDIDDSWRSTRNNSGVSFSMSSLGGMILLGRTGMKSAISHAPKDDKGKSRFIFYAFPHVGVHSCGELGHIRRIGLDEDSSVCGALEVVRKEIVSGFVKYDMDPLDYEYCALKHRMLSHLEYGKKPTISELTVLAHQIIVSDLEALIQEVTTNHPNFDYAVFTGIQIHRPTLETDVYPGKCYGVKDGVRHDFQDRMSVLEAKQ